MTERPTPRPEQRVASQHGGKVHTVRYVRNPWAPGEWVEVPGCMRNGGNVIGTRAVADGTEVTCARCKNHS